MNPAEDEREGDGKGEHPAPGEAQVHDPAQVAAPTDEPLGREVVEQQPSEIHTVTDETALPEQTPASLPVPLGRWALQPDRVAVGNRRGGKDQGERIREQGQIKVA